MVTNVTFVEIIVGSVAVLLNFYCVIFARSYFSSFSKLINRLPIGGNLSFEYFLNIFFHQVEHNFITCVFA